MPTTRPAGITFKVVNFIDAIQLKKDLTYSLADLSSARAEQAALFVHYGTLAAKAAKQVDDAKMLLEITESKVYRKLRDEAATTATKVTEVQLEKTVQVHETVISMRRALNEAKQIEAIAKTAAEGFRQRRDMLVQDGATSREEMKGEISVATRRIIADEHEAQKARILAMAAARKSSDEAA